MELQVEIVIDTNQPLCIENCGKDWSSLEAHSVINTALLRQFGAGVHLTVTNLSCDTAAKRKYRKEKDLPLLVINGKTRLVGQFETRQIIDSVQTELELRSGK